MKKHLLALSVAAAVAAATTSPAGTGPATASAEAATTATPNIVLILTDDQTYESVARMPYVSSRRWITFPHAYAENALCCPSRASILSGQYDYHNNVVNNSTAQRLDETNTVATWLDRAGYRTGLFGKYFNAYPFGGGLYTPPGWDEWHAVYGDGTYRQYNYTIDDNGVSRSYGTAEADYLGDQLQQRAVQFVNSTPSSQPLFLYFTPTATHIPWNPAPRDVGTFSGVTMPSYPNLNEADVSDKPAWVRALPLLDLKVAATHRRREWTAALGVDLAVKRIEEALAATGRLSNTVEIFMTDNGYSFGAHRWGTKRCAYEECTHLPFLVRFPGQAPRVENRLVSNIDIAPTFADVANLTPPISQDGISLVPLITNQVTNWRGSVLQHWVGGTNVNARSTEGIPAFWALRTKRYRYVELLNGEKELYDLNRDPFERVNRVDDPDYAAVRTQLSAQLAAKEGPQEPAPAVVITNQPRD